MLVIGELINSSRKSVGEAINNRDGEFLVKLARDQVEAGADLVDVNCAVAGEKEPETMAWLVQLIQEAVDVRICLDSPNPAALEAGLKVHKGRAMINSISGEKERFAGVLALLQNYDTDIVALCMDDSGMASSAGHGFQLAQNLVDHLHEGGIEFDRIYLDPLVRPVATNTEYGNIFLGTARRISAEVPGIHITSGLSNISYGLPERRHLNQAFLVAAMAAGMDSVICNPLDGKLMALMYATEALLGRDEFCAQYIQAQRDGRLDTD